MIAIWGPSMFGTTSETEESESKGSQSTESLSSWTGFGAERDARETSPALNKQRVDLQTGRLLGHLRKEFVQFVVWIFGPQGVVSLQIVAFGDFAHGKFEREHNALQRQ
ncbi:uncharacterized protein PG998_002934 [Apiospora kogelbergensis]|uniref:uncharacterized protein n=1 Tax=Apiospora kogelbergensis TaxID=1337665 RepID=UPI00312F016A